MKKTLTLQMILLSLAALAIGGLAVLSFYMVKQKNSEATQLTELADKRSSELALANATANFREENASNISSLDELIITDDELVSAISKIESVNSVIGTKTTIISLEKEKVTKEVDPHKIHLVIEAQSADQVKTFEKAFQFVKSLENLPFRADIEEGRLTLVGDKWVARVSLVLYLFKPHE
ncbi:hypothetical protein KW807_02005 [Candidatus Parcubacteria bacterium]|nr:hypothetical protein [Candidatus Parcubacteria bacterium]